MQARSRALGALGLVLPTFPQRAHAPTDGTLTEICRRAESSGAAALWACDHLYWHSPSLECLTATTVAAISTERALIGTCVLQLPLRSAPAVAKQASSIQVLSGGRLVLGVGLGSHRGEYEAAGADFAGRARALDEGITTLRAAWGQSATDAAYTQMPEPEEVPVWVGGSSESALRRAARLADGWIPLFLSPAELSSALERLDKEADREGRDPRTISRAMVVFVTTGGTRERADGLEWMSSLYRLPPAAFERQLISGTAADCGRRIRRYFDAGAQHVAVFVARDDPLEVFAELAGELGDTAT